ncbi:zf-HC2 domain-containing protein [Ruania suaedae]|uniref:anti-sigma factor family protein n=1 Tax=Ruania suaedae TaxID=2897774 RepID=UPI001E33B33B|nr:zf-HC2 domain-containing protein [Ruania suaedae]UFU03934.1 zf-HC2 domain-containing protein [Ruania suaedae]
MSHLGPLVSPFVDGQLPPARAARLQQHLSDCAPCRAQVEAERACRDTARAARAVQANPDLTERLLALGVVGDTTGVPASAGEVERAVRGTRLRVLSGAVASVGVFVVALFVLGGQQRSVDDLTAMVPQLKEPASLAGGHAVGSVGATEPGREDLSGTVLEWMSAAGWSTPDRLPAGMRVEHITVIDEAEAGAPVLQLDLAGDAGVVHLTEQHGVLDPAMTAALEPVQISGYEVYQVAENWWVAQCGGSVVAISSGDDPAAAHALLARMGEGTSPGVVDRLTNGLQVLLAGS